MVEDADIHVAVTIVGFDDEFGEILRVDGGQRLSGGMNELVGIYSERRVLPLKVDFKRMLVPEAMHDLGLDPGQSEGGCDVDGGSHGEFVVRNDGADIMCGLEVGGEIDQPAIAPDAAGSGTAEN